MEMNITVLTPNRRLAAYLHKQHQQEQIGLGKQSWFTADILPINVWLQKVWQDYSLSLSNPPMFLTSILEQQLWEKIIQASSDYDHLLRLSETAETVRSAYYILKQWCVSVDHPIFNETEDSRALRKWILQYQAVCKKENWIDQVGLVDALIDGSGNLFQNKLQLIGFTEFSPQLRKLFSFFDHVEYLETLAPKSQTDIHSLCLQDSEEELTTIARWAKSIYTNDKNARIACVLPNLDKTRDRVMQVFTEIFYQENALQLNLKNLPFNVSAGKSLSTFPVVAIALKILGMHKQTLTRELLIEILTSPFIGEAEQERLERYALDIFLRRNNISSLHLAEFSKLPQANACPLFEKRLGQFLQSVDEKYRSHSEWSVQFTHLLLAMGWPGERSLNSEEYQTIDTWMNLLREFSTLDYGNSSISFGQALSELKKLAANKIFQPESPEANIQVLGILEAASIPFDYLWVAGMDDISWPQQPNPNPFIPKRLQRELQMPHANAERELSFCSLLTEQFKQSAKVVIFSHIKHQSEIKLQISPLLQDIPEIDLATLLPESYLSLSELQYTTKNLEIINDDIAPSYTSESKVIGGVDVLKQQALCPFKAFATYRLHARELESPLPGLRAKDKGEITHKILELIWQQLKTHSALLVLSDSDLDVIIKQSIDIALTNFNSLLAKRTQYLLLEKQRLHKLIFDWLMLEKIRDPFEVLMQEQNEEIVLNRLRFSIRVDRVDLIDGQKKLIIDYKTGEQNFIDSWFDARMDAPQLPIYTTLDPDHTIGITFAQIVSGNSGFKGVSQYKLQIKGIKEFSTVVNEPMNWQTQLQTWKTYLLTLSDEFFAGNAKVDPKENDETCQYCQLKPLCRIYEDCHH